MGNTSAEVYIELNNHINLTTECESTNVNEDISSISNFVTKTSTIQNSYFATLEHNLFLLDGKISIAEPSVKPYGYYGTEMSDDNCVLKDSNVKIILNPIENNPVDIYGITIYFGNILYCSAIEYIIAQRDISQKKTIYPKDDTLQIVFSDTKDIQSITVNFINTKFPGMHPRVSYVYIGLFYHFTDKDIISLVLNEEISPISSALPVNTATLSVYSPTGEYDITNNVVLPAFLKNNSHASIYAIIDDIETCIAELLIDSWEAKNKYELTFNFVSRIKELDDFTHPAFDYIYNDNLDEWLNLIGNVGFSVNVPNNTNRYNIYLKQGTYRELYQQVLFLYGMMVNDLHGNSFNITKLDTYKIKATLYTSQVLDDLKLTKVDPKNAITVNTIDYVQQLNGSYWNSYMYTHLYKGEINGSITLEFNKPADSFRYRLIPKTGSNTASEGIKNRYAGGVIQVNGNLSVNEYLDKGQSAYPSQWWYNTFDYRHVLAYTFIPQNYGDINYRDYIFDIYLTYEIEKKSQYKLIKNNTVNQNLIYIDKPDIFNSDNVKEFAKNTLDFYNNIDLKVEASYINTDLIRAGDTIYMYVDNNTKIKTTVVKQSIDLANGFLTKMTGISNTINYIANQYMSSNSDAVMYMDDNTIL